MSSTAVSNSSQSQRTRSGDRINFSVAVGDGVGWPLGMAFFSVTTLVPDFLLRLHASYFVIGLFPALLNLGYFIPGVFVASRVSKLPLVRPWLFWVGIAERIPLFLIAWLTYSVGARYPGVLMIGFFVLFGMHALALGCNQPAYWVLIGKLIPENWRGRLFGVAGLIGGILGLGVDRVTSFFLDRAPAGSMNGYADCFLLGAVLIFVSFVPFWIVREHASNAPAKDAHAGHYYRDIQQVLRSNKPFRMLVWTQLAFSFWTAAPSFFLAAAQNHLHIGPDTVALYVKINVVAMSLGNIVWGAWADRSGNKVVLVVVSAMLIGGAIMTLIPLGVTGYAFVFGITALGIGGASIAGNNMVLEFAPTEGDVSFYLATFNVISAIGKIAAPIIGGLVAMRLGFMPVFAGSLVCAVAMFALSCALTEPRIRHPAAVREVE